MDMILGHTGGTIGETSMIAIVLGACILIMLDIIDLLETDLNMPVVTSDQASLWACLRHSGVGTRIPELGELFRK